MGHLYGYAVHLYNKEFVGTGRVNIYVPAPGKQIIFAATGVTDGSLMRGVRFFGSGKRTHSLVMTSESKHIRFVDTMHIEGGPDTVIRF